MSYIREIIEEWQAETFEEERKHREGFNYYDEQDETLDDEDK